MPTQRELIVLKRGRVLEKALATPYIGDFGVVVAGRDASITMHQQEKTR